MIVADVTKMQEAAGWADAISAAGFGQTEREIRSFVAALQSTGIPFANVQNAINAFTTTGLGSVDATLSTLAAKLGISYTPGVGEAAGGAIISQYTEPSFAASWKFEGMGQFAYEKAKSYRYLPSDTAWWLSEAPKWEDNSWWISEYNPYTQSANEWRRLAKGGATNGPSIAGESGIEWVAPTYEPQRSNFLRDTGVADTLKSILEQGGPGDGTPIQVNLVLDGRVIQSVVAKGMKTNRDLIASTQKAARMAN